jgi:hypothetical protein
MDRRVVPLLTGSGVVVAAALVYLAYLAITPLYRDMARRHQATGIIVATDDVTREIRYRVEQKKTLAGSGKGLAIAAGGPVTSATVSDDGVIVLNGRIDSYPVVVALKPSLRNGEIEWRCRQLKWVDGWFEPESGYFSKGCARAASLESF